MTDLQEVLDRIEAIETKLRDMGVDLTPRIGVRKADVRMTGDASPSQWEGCTIGGQTIYIRYRWGHLSVHSPFDFPNGEANTRIFGEQIRDNMDGCMESDEMYALTTDVIKWVE